MSTCYVIGYRQFLSYIPITHLDRLYQFYHPFFYPKLWSAFVFFQTNPNWKYLNRWLSIIESYFWIYLHTTNCQFFSSTPLIITSFINQFKLWRIIHLLLTILMFILDFVCLTFDLLNIPGFLFSFFLPFWPSDTTNELRLMTLVSIWLVHRSLL